MYLSNLHSKFIAIKHKDNLINMWTFYLITMKQNVKNDIISLKIHSLVNVILPCIDAWILFFQTVTQRSIYLHWCTCVSMIENLTEVQFKHICDAINFYKCIVNRNFLFRLIKKTLLCGIFFMTIFHLQSNTITVPVVSYLTFINFF